MPASQDNSRRLEPPLPVPQTPSTFHPLAQRNVFRRRDARQRQRLFAPWHPLLRRSPSSNRTCSDCQRLFSSTFSQAFPKLNRRTVDLHSRARKRQRRVSKTNLRPKPLATMPRFVAQAATADGAGPRLRLDFAGETLGRTARSID
jgi:hypothetical protein